MSQWGHDFRPEYLRLREVVEALGRLADRRRDRDRRRADARRDRRQAVRAEAENLRPLVRPAEPLPGDAAEGQRDPAADRPPRRPPRRVRHRLLRLAPTHRGAGAGALRHRPPGAALPRRARPRRAGGEPGRLPARGRLRRVRHHRLRHGHRQAGRALRVPRRHAVLDRGLLPGDRPRRTRRLAGGHVHPLRRRRHRAAPPPDRRERRAGGAQAGRDGEARRSRDPVRDGALPPPDPARHVRRGVRALRPLRRVQRRGAADRRTHRGAEGAVGRAAHVRAVLLRPPRQHPGRQDRPRRSSGTGTTS